MKNLLELKSSLGRIHQGEQEYEIFAEGVGAYDEASNMLTMNLSCFLQEEAVARTIVHPDWMPHRQTDREHVDRDEASDLGREIFRRWCDAIEHSAPRPLH